MKKIVAIAAVVGFFVVFFMWLPTPKNKESNSSLKIITHANVFTGTQWLDNVDVVFDKGIVIEVNKNLEEKYRTASIIQAENQYLIPGLIDSHTHAWGDALKKAVRFGITTELDMFTNTAFAAGQRKLRDEHEWNVRQADLFSAGILATAPKGHGTEYGIEIPVISSANEAEAFIAARIAEGSDYIKIIYSANSTWMPSIDRATLNALVSAARAQKKLVMVHVDSLMSAEHAIAAGADGLAHSFMDNLQDGDMLELIALMQENNSFVVPTLSVLGSMVGQGAIPNLQADFLAVGYNLEDVEAALEQTISQESHAQAFLHAKENVARFIHAGIPVLAGTDAPNPGMVHGLSLHNELALLVQSGFSPTQALQAATIAPAQMFHLEKRGQIKAGMKADFVLLSKDPKADIRHTRSIVSVYKNGYLINKNIVSIMGETIAFPASLGDFEAQTESRESSVININWYTTTDEIAQGDSSVSIQIIEGINNNHVMQIKGAIGGKFSYPWAGMYLPLTDSEELGVDLSKVSSLNFQAKGTAGSYKVMLFSTNQPIRPIELVFTVGSQWQEASVSLSSVNQGLLKSISGIAIVAGKEHEAFELNIDDIWLR